MGRPLFSSKFNTQNREPHIRVQPEATPAHPTYDTWLSHPFDPDSDEFFERDAVYEAFVDPNQPPAQPAEETTEPVVRPFAVVVPVSPSESSSDSDSSGRSTPVDMTDNRYTRLGLEVRRAERSRSNSRSPVYNAPRMVRESSEDNLFRHPNTMVFHSRLRVAVDSNTEDRVVTTPDPSAPIPIIAPRTPPIRSIPVTDAPVLTASPLPLPATPSTPPSQVAANPATPSPAPSVTPRLYNWDTLQSRDIYGTPTASGPLPNRGARMSVAHITPIASHVVV